MHEPSGYAKRTHFANVSPQQDALLADFHDALVAAVSEMERATLPAFDRLAVDPIHVRALVILALCKSLGENSRAYLDAGAHPDAPDAESLMFRIEHMIRAHGGLPQSPFLVPHNEVLQ